MTMSVGELKELLEGMDDEVEVRLMTQEPWPFENTIRCSVLASELEDFKPEGSEGEVLYLVDGGQLGYGTKDAWNR